MDGNSNKASVIVTPFTADGGQVKWQVEVVGKGKGGPGNYPVLDIPHKQGPTKIDIAIVNPPGYSFKFAKDSAALWVSAGPGDPTGPSTYPDQIPVDKIKTKQQDGRLEFVDLNKGAKIDLHYTLNFVSADGKTASTLDPIIRNGGGGGPGFDYAQYIGIAAVGLLAAALLVLVFRRTRAQGPQA